MAPRSSPRSRATTTCHHSNRAHRSRLGWAPDAPYLLRGRSIVVGATSTDVDEVQAALDGTDDRRHRRHGRHRGTARAPIRPPQLLIGGGIVAAGAVGAVVLSSVGGERRRRRWRHAAAAGGAGGGIGQGSSDLQHPQLDRVHRRHRGRRGRHRRPLLRRDRRLRQLLGDLERQQRGLRQGVRGVPRGGQPDPVGHRHADLLDGSPPEVQGMVGAAARSTSSRTTSTSSRPYLDVAWDPGGKFNLPWQAGITGFAYNISETGRELKSINDLFDPEFSGRIGLFTEMRDTLGLVMLGQGNDPSVADRGRDQPGARPGRGGHQLGPGPPLHRQRLPPGHPERQLRGVHRMVG